jgi:hypothetical protein
MALLTTGVPDTSWITQTIRLGEDIRQRKEAMEQERIERDKQQLQQALADQRRSFEISRRQEFERSKDSQELAFKQANADRVFSESKRRFDLENEPFTLPGEAATPSASVAGITAPPAATGDGKTVDLWNAGAENAGPILGKVTDYGQSDDPYKDSASLGIGKWSRPTGAWNNALKDTSLAISPDVEKQFKAAGIKEGDSVLLKLDNGQMVERTWDDRTMQDKQAIEKFGKPLRGRFDFFSPRGASPLRDRKVVGFTLPSSVPSVNALKDDPSGPLPVGSSEPQSASLFPEESSSQSVVRAMQEARTAAERASVGLPRKQAIANINRAIATAQRQAQSPRRTTGQSSGPKVIAPPDGWTRNDDGTYADTEGVPHKVDQWGRFVPLSSKPETASTKKASAPSVNDEAIYSTIKPALAPLDNALKKVSAAGLDIDDLAKMSSVDSYNALKAANVSEGQAGDINHAVQVLYPVAKKKGGLDSAKAWVDSYEKRYASPAEQKSPVEAPAATSDEKVVVVKDGKKFRLPKSQLSEAQKQGYSVL